VAGLATTLGSGAMTNSLEEIFKSNVALLIGTNTTEAHPVFGSMIKQAAKNHGLKLIVCDPRRIELAERADIWLQLRHGSDTALLCGLQHIILREGWHNQRYIDERCENFDAYCASMDWFTPARVEELTGISQRDQYAAAEMLAKSGRGALYYCLGVTEHCHGVDNVKACVNLQLILGNVGVEGGGVNPLRGQNNVQGACDMGALPNYYTGYQRVDRSEVRARFARSWGVDESALSLVPGLTETQMIPACGGELKALYVTGENPVISEANANLVRASLQKLDLLIVEDLFINETAELAHVVLPALSFAEKQGTFTNTERRVQLSNRAIKPLEGARADYEIVAELAARFGHHFPRTPDGLFAEIRRLTPIYSGISYERIREVGLQWPCPDEMHPGTKFLHQNVFTRGKALLSPLTYTPSAEVPDAEWPFLLSSGRILEHYDVGAMSRRAPVLTEITNAGFVEIHPDDAAHLGICDGDRVRIVTRRGAVTTSARIATAVKPGTLFVSFHFAEEPMNQLTNDALDPIAQIPELKVCAARIERI